VAKKPRVSIGLNGEILDDKPDADGLTRWAREDDDVKLMLRFQKGEQEAFEELVHRNAPKVNTLIYRFLGDPGQVEDLTQEVFLRVYRTAARYQPTAKFSTWLYRIAANLSFNVLRAKRRGQPVQLEIAYSEDGEPFYRDVPDARHVPPHDRLDAEELRGKVGDAINQLPENQKVAIILNKYEQKSYEDIAAILDCSTMAVKSLLSRARSNLRSALMRYIHIE
jgi:RNA polymerase sigma-70 factor (ECF subfamily)